MSEAGETVEQDAPEGAKKPMRTRKRNDVTPDQRTEIANRVVKFYQDEKMLRDRGRNARLQRYAKYRMWQQGTDWPWPDAADTAIPDMLQDSLRVQDTLNNAVLSQKPAIVSTASLETDKGKEKVVDNLLQFQFFRENKGETIIGEMAEAFANDPSCNVFVPWVREKKKVADIKVFDPMPEDADPEGYFRALLKAQIKDISRMDTKGGWDWDVIAAGEELEVCFYTNEADEIEMVIEREAIIYDGPRVLMKDYDDVLFPARSANLQPPSPANPGGAPYVILRDFPILSEIASLQQSGYYDLLTKEDLEKLTGTSSNAQFESESAKQKDDFAGAQEQPGRPRDASHKKLTRLMCFDTYDMDGDGIGEDYVFTVILEAKVLTRSRRLSDVSPGSPPQRPLFGKSFHPVGGRHDGMSLLETMEGLHDATKVLVDQGINANDLAIASPGFYRPSGGMNPEVLRIEPFTLSPLQNPQQDVVFPQIGNSQAMGFSLNMVNMLGMWQDKTTMVSDNSFGQVAPGSSSALRTIGGMAMLNGQGEARPERILRRFFSIIADIYEHMHRLNSAYLPKGKQFRILGFIPEGTNPFVTLDDRSKYAGDFAFGFDANAFNTSKAALQSALMDIMKVTINPLAIQLGNVTAENVYNLLADYISAKGQQPNRYVTPTKAQGDGPKILAQEAITEIMHNQLPIGEPLEAGGPQEHLAALIAYMESNEFGLLKPHQVDLFRQYMAQVRQLVAAQNQQQAVLQHASTFAANANQSGPGAPAQQMPQAPGRPAPVSGPAELQDERLPGAGGGANGA
jgi:hypothetical protein